MLLFSSFLVHANNGVSRELAVIKKVMEARQARVDKAMQDVKNSYIDPRQFVLKKMPHEKMKFEGRMLKCQISHFSWKGKQDGYEYEDCVFTFNIKSDDDVRAMLNTVARRGLEGWEIDRSEQTAQKNIMADNIINKEKYRFKRKYPTKITP